MRLVTTRRAHGPQPCTCFRDSFGFTDFMAIAKGYADAFQPFGLDVIETGRAVPVRVRRVVVAILASQTGIAGVVEIPASPRNTDARGVRAIEGGPPRLHTLFVDR